ncbi:TetR/AcrR family transcriptional regulator [Paenibacillus sp. XY044]|uniref:TetR/AcrR family transcriptional regulator n=1 Tax=Paenibacillus sp. XY044 TaxID=2026089 RepID=UPI000B98B97F|nr:TetR/AcrR family transcriptional regulator [Paenibacillus sp. XY044]OZB93513.1 transcriptional regulator [Paenibacillus sp. XY044]
MKKRKYEAEQTKQTIVEGAKALFAAKGYAATSMMDICEATGCSKGSIYHHFQSKEDLFLYLAEQAFTNSWQTWHEQSEGERSATDQLYAYADYFVDTLQKPLNKAGEEFMIRVGAESEAGRRFMAIIQNYMKGFEDLVQAGLDSGEWRGESVQELSFMILSYYSGLSDSYHLMDKAAMKELFRKATTLLLDGIRK